MTGECEVRYDVDLLLDNNPIGLGKNLKGQEVDEIIRSVEKIIKILQAPPKLSVKIYAYRVERD